MGERVVLIDHAPAGRCREQWCAQSFRQAEQCFTRSGRFRSAARHDHGSLGVPQEPRRVVHGFVGGDGSESADRAHGLSRSEVRLQHLVCDLQHDHPGCSVHGHVDGTP